MNIDNATIEIMNVLNLKFLYISSFSVTSIFFFITLSLYSSSCRLRSSTCFRCLCPINCISFSLCCSFILSSLCSERL